MDFYRGSLWDVPGYENFTAGEDAADVTVYMAVREEPVPYLQLNSGGQTRFYDDFTAYISTFGRCRDSTCCGRCCAQLEPYA
ncbi:MAG: hypothetical protein ACLTYN_10235 [Dysosmobacter welbionis]